MVSIQVRRHRLCRACIEDTSGSNHNSPASSCSFDDNSDEPASAGGDLGARDIIRTFGKMRITVRIRDRRIEAGTDIPKTQLDANFSQSPTHRNFLLKRGVIQTNGDEMRTYIPSLTECSIYGRFLASLLLVQGRAIGSRA